MKGDTLAGVHMRPWAEGSWVAARIISCYASRLIGGKIGKQGGNMSGERQQSSDEQHVAQTPGGDTPAQAEGNRNTCPECGGSGKVQEDVNCPRCGGTGYVLAAGTGG